MPKNILVLHGEPAEKYKPLADGYAAVIQSQARSPGDVAVSTKSITNLKPEDLSSHAAIVTALPRALTRDPNVRDVSKLTAADYQNLPPVNDLFNMVLANAERGVPYVRIVSGAPVNVPAPMDKWVDDIGGKQVPRISGVASDRFRNNHHQGLDDKGLDGVNELLAALEIPHKNGKPDHNVGNPVTGGSLGQPKTRML